MLTIYFHCFVDFFIQDPTSPMRNSDDLGRHNAFIPLQHPYSFGWGNSGRNENIARQNRTTRGRVYFCETFSFVSSAPQVRIAVGQNHTRKDLLRDGRNKIYIRNHNVGNDSAMHTHTHGQTYRRVYKYASGEPAELSSSTRK